MDPAQRAGGTVEVASEKSFRQQLEIGGGQIDQVIKAAFFYGQRSIHVSFGKKQPRSDEELPVQCPVVQPDYDAGAGRTHKIKALSFSVNDLQSTYPDDPLEEKIGRASCREIV